MNRLSEAKRKVYAKLKDTKYRSQYKLFVAEGEKVCETLRNLYEVEAWIVEQTQIDSLERRYPFLSESPVYTVDTHALRTLSQLDSTRSILGIFRIPPITDLPAMNTPYCVGLDGIQDPGNLGTIIRLCDWLGVAPVLCGEGCADIYNPKVIQATTGALHPKRVYPKVDLCEIIDAYNLTVIGTRMEGQSLFGLTRSDILLPAMIVFGNEGKGISPRLWQRCNSWITIPKAQKAYSESLNVGMSAAIVLSHLLQL